jgi:hypothetical protein
MIWDLQLSMYDLRFPSQINRQPQIANRKSSIIVNNRQSKTYL